jgi:hypothetical protein
MARPSELVCQELGGKLQVLKDESLGRGVVSWSAGIWSCHGDARMRLLSARASTKEEAHQALDERLLSVARQLLGKAGC